MFLFVFVLIDWLLLTDCRIRSCAIFQPFTILHSNQYVMILILSVNLA